MDYSKVVSSRIRGLCAQRKISINRLAAMSGLRQSSVDNILRGVSKRPNIQTLHKIATAFGLTLSEFLDFPEMNSFPTEDDTE